MAESIFKAYDIRGTYPEQLDEDGVYQIIQAYIEVVKPTKVVVTRDVREHGPQLQKAAIQSFVDAGVDVIDAGLVSTDMFYWAVATLPVDGGVTLSASHNAREWNGLNMAGKGAAPISQDSGLNDIKQLALTGHTVKSERTGTVEQHDLLDDYCRWILSLIDVEKLPTLTIAANPNHGYQGIVFERIIELGKLPISVKKIYFDPDGTFPLPEGHPNPLIEENRHATVELVKSSQADLGVSWDADGDRCFLVDETGRFIEGYFTTAVLAVEQLKKHPGGKVLIDPRLIWASIEAIEGAGGTAIITKPGMSLIAKRMKDEGAIFAGEMSAHYFFPETFNRDNGMLPLFRVLELMASSGKKLSALYDPYLSKYFVSGEINNKVESVQNVLTAIEEQYGDGKIEHIDGVSVEFDDWRCNVRASNTEPLLRLNVEAKSSELMEEKRDELLALIRG
ncbi:phosphomannomutase/phosphoglucomutase [Candidatus Berkelbacteria bacterium]|nr:phosphomannomutase/phosphoglucomutase [Candidatus Berkelbacteria bacterium]